MTEKKRCTKCGEEKELGEFHKRKDGVLGRTSHCKTCTGLYHKEYLSKPEGKEKKTEQRKNRVERNREHYLQLSKSYYKKNKDQILQNNKQWKIKNKNHMREHNKDRRKTDIQYKLTLSLRSRLYSALKNELKTGSAIKDLGCSIEFLKKYLEKQFYPNPETREPMNWNNYGVYGWHIDHIKPLTLFNLTDREQLLTACNYKNLQPLWAKENIRKGNRLEIL